MLNSVEYSICEIQGDIFSLAADRGYDIESFVNAYLASDFCRRQFDTLYSHYQLADAGESWDNFYPEIKDRIKMHECGKYFRSDVAWWMGFTYRQLWYETEYSSAEILKKIPVNTMISLYAGYHTIDEEMAAERLIESFGLTAKSQAAG